MDSLKPGENVIGDIIDFYLEHIWATQLQQSNTILFVQSYTAQAMKVSESSRCYDG